MPAAESAIAHPLVRPGFVERRAYQVAVAAEALKRNTLVILPTGLGKTVIALLVIAGRLERKPGRVLFLAPTKPLVEQHAEFLRGALAPSVGRVDVFTGEVAPAAREKAWREAAIVCSTPEVVVNDLVQERLDLREFTMVVFDEAHRAVGDYAYVFVADKYRRVKLEGLVLGMTASPGASPQRAVEVCRNLGIEGVEVRTESDPDVAPHVQDVGVRWERVRVPGTIQRVAGLLKGVLDDRVKQLRALGVYKAPFVSKKELLALQGRLQAQIREHGRNPPSHLFQALSAQAAALKAGHALELVETQGVGAASAYLGRLAKDESKAAKGLLADARVEEARRLVEATAVEHPKLRKAARLVEDQLAVKPDSRIIVFTHYRDTAETLARELAKLDGVRPARFVGQQTKGEDKGLSQAEQTEIVRRFREGEHNVLVATSVAEEGLDIPATDLVVFFEPVPSEIRSIQRRGRTGRRRAGQVVVLVTEGTRDETYLWASHGKEKKMRALTDALRRTFARVNASEDNREWERMFTGEKTARTTPEKPLTEFSEDTEADGAAEPEGGEEGSRGNRIVVVADHREFASAVVKRLSLAGVAVKADALEVADYVLSDRVAVERKEASDYVASLLDGRLFKEVRALRDAYASPILVLEGRDLLTARRVDPAAVYASLASVVADFRVAVLQTADEGETADLLAAIAKREQVEERRAPALRGSKGTMTDMERLRYVVEGLPGVSAVLARRLLSRFSTLRVLAAATVDELQEVEGVGPEKAAAIHRVLNLAFLEEAPQRRGEKPRGKAA